MDNIVVRPYEDRDEDGFYTVRSLTYNNGLPIAPENRLSRFGSRFVAENGAGITGIFSTLDLCVTRGLGSIRCAGVASVGVSPDVRRSGVGLEMMRWSVGHFKESGIGLASLYAFREPFYAKVGYVVCGKRVKLSVPTHRLPKVDSHLPVRRLAPTDWRELDPCFRGFAHSRSGTNLRSEKMWERVLAEVKPLAIYAVGDPVEGYIAISHQVAFWEEQWLSEVVWSSKAGYEGCLSLMHRLGINKTSLGWFEPSDSPFYAKYLDQGITAEIVRPAMFRVCDVKACLEALKPSGSGEFSICVNDLQAPENCGPWMVSFRDGSVEVRKFEGAHPGLEIGIGPFTQAYLGDPSLAELANFGEVLVNREEDLKSALQLLQASPVYLSDFF